MIVFILSIVWYIRILRNILSYVHLWFVKEYRIDRMLIHLRTRQGKRIYFPERKEPPVSPKTITLVIALVFVSLSCIIYLPLPLLVRVGIVDLLVFPVSFIFVSLLGIPTFFYHRYKIAKSEQALTNHKPMVTIGITGSFGKTSTKDFLASILKGKYYVLKTEESKNSPIGISETILTRLAPTHSAFVVEMGAYKRGEIERMATMVHPSIAVITAVNAQHQDLFRSIETTKLAKYELVRALPKKHGIAVMNLDNEYVRDMAGWAIRDGFTVWGVTANNKYHGEVKNVFHISDISSTVDSIMFSFIWKNKRSEVTIPLRGEHFVMNIGLALAAAIAAGMTFSEAVKALGNIQSVHRVMERTEGKNGQTLINDTFNNNPDAAAAALKYLQKFDHNRLLVFQPMIELGNFSDKAHSNVGALAAHVCDSIILTNSNFSEAFIRGVKKIHPKKVVNIFSPKEAINYITQTTSSKDTILFKGKEAAFVFEGVARSKSSHT